MLDNKLCDQYLIQLCKLINILILELNIILNYNYAPLPYIPSIICYCLLHYTKI